mgnify:FL=1
MDEGTAVTHVRDHGHRGTGSANTRKEIAALTAIAIVNAATTARKKVFGLPIKEETDRGRETRRSQRSTERVVLKIDLDFSSNPIHFINTLTITLAATLTLTEWFPIVTHSQRSFDSSLGLLCRFMQLGLI